MLKKLAGFSLAILIVSSSHLLKAEEQASTGYEEITPAQPTANPAKVEVIEFFWYGCPHCYSFEPSLSKWLKTKPDNVDFIRIPAVFSEEWGNHAKAYFTAEALGVVDAVHSDLFDGVQKLNRKISTPLKQRMNWQNFLLPTASKKQTFAKLISPLWLIQKCAKRQLLPQNMG